MKFGTVIDTQGEPEHMNCISCCFSRGAPRSLSLRVQSILLISWTRPYYVAPSRIVVATMKRDARSPCPFREENHQGVIVILILGRATAAPVEITLSIVAPSNPTVRAAQREGTNSDGAQVAGGARLPWISENSPFLFQDGNLIFSSSAQVLSEE